MNSYEVGLEGLRFLKRSLYTEMHTCKDAAHLAFLTYLKETLVNLEKELQAEHVVTEWLLASWVGQALLARPSTLIETD